jgi:hypothetical protein
MVFAHLMLALVMALVLSAIFALGFRRTGPWASVPLFFLIIFLASWAGGIWLAPVGPPLWGTYWLPFLMVGLVFALLLAAIPPTKNEKSTVELINQEKRARERRKAFLALGVSLWILLGLFAAVIIIRYVH